MHHAAEALALLADTEHEQFHRAVRARRILVPTRTLPGDHNIPRPYAPALVEDTRTLLAAYRDTSHAARRTAAAVGRAAHAENAPSRILATARDITHTTSQAIPAKQTGQTQASARQPQPVEVPGPLQHTLASLGVTDSALLARGRDLDHASQRLLIDAADHLPPTPHQPPATILNQTPATAVILNHALATGETRAVRVLHQRGRTG